jgi:uncharacterized protein YycO
MIIGDIVLVKENRFFSKIIKYFTQSDYSHAGIIVGVYGADLIVVESRLISGVKKSLYNINSKKITIFTHIDMVEEKRQKLLGLSISMVGKGYDWKGVLYRAWLTITFRRRNPNKWNDKAAFYCSELVSFVYEKVGLVFDMNILPENITPENIASSKFTMNVNLEE